MIDKLKNYGITAITMLIGLGATTVGLFLVVWWVWFIWEMIKFVFRYSWFDNPF